MANRKVAYTYIFGGYDDLRNPRIITKGWDYICFTDNPDLRSDIWQVKLSYRKENEQNLNDKKYAMKHKILFYHYLEDYQLSLAIDGRIMINCNLDYFLNKHFRAEDDMLLPRHPWRECIYLEGEECKRLGLDEPEQIDSQMNKYKAEGYPTNNGLHATGLIARRHGRQHLRDLCNLWFDELKKGSKRDQLSFNYALWKSKPVKISEINYMKNFYRKKDFILSTHRVTTNV